MHFVRAGISGNLKKINNTEARNLYNSQSIQSFTMATGTSKFTDAFLSEIPKTDLHMHLDGSMRISTIIDLAKKNNVELPDYTVQGLRQKVFKSKFSSLVEYLRCFKYTVAVLQTSEALERAAYELACDNFAEGVRYFEVRFAPQLHAHLPSKAAEEGHVLDIREVLRSVNRGLRRACDEWNKRLHARQATSTLDCVREPEYHCAIIVSALRMFDSTFSEYYRALVQCHRHEGMQRIYGLASMALVTAAVAARDEEGIPVVALDVAGAERGHPAANHQAAYHYAQRHFLNTTCHAGEAYGPESIYQAITLLHAERIGHGYHIFSEKMVSAKNKDKAKQLTDNIIQYVAERRITLEVCLSSNLGTMPGLKIQDHHLGRMLQHRLSVALCTDNRLVSDTSIVKELKLAINTFGITLKQLRDIVITGFKRSFFSKSYREKRSYVRCAMNYFDFICSKHGLELPRHCYVAPPASPSVGDIPSVISPNPSVTITNESSQVSATVYKPSALYQTTTHVNSDKSAFVSPTKKSTE